MDVIDLDDVLILQGHVLDALNEIADESVNCVVTSPPYWGLRRYDAPDAIWGGDPECPHALEGVSRQETPEAWVKEVHKGQTGGTAPSSIAGGRGQMTNVGSYVPPSETATCSRCGAWRGQYGLEPTPQMYVEHTVEVLRAIRRVLWKDGVVWWNIGDGYNVKPKNMDLMPFRVALAAQEDGWWVRSVIIWHKPNAMPSSVKDRPSSDFEYILMLTKSARYWWDQDAVREPYAEKSLARYQHPFNKIGKGISAGGESHAKGSGTESIEPSPKGRNLRTVWTFPTQSYPDAHFAVFPIELPTRCIKAACPPDGIVLDPFVGSGTSLLAARHLGRSAIGIELSEKYVTLCQKRLAKDK